MVKQTSCRVTRPTVSSYLGGGRAGHGEVGQLGPELDAARVGVDIEDDEGLSLRCVGCVWE
jgi:hypothetical protein